MAYQSARHQAKAAHRGFMPGDVVWTPMKRRAVLKQFKDGRWGARYVGESEHTGATILDPRHIKLVDE